MTANSPSLPFSIVPLPTSPDHNRQALVAGGYPQPALQRLQGYSEDEFEQFVYELVHGCWSQAYERIMQLGGAGDRGRDIVAYEHYPDVWDLYQCKHYGVPLAPSDFWVELGKLCHYTFEKAYTTPQRYYIVTSHGVGPKLHDLLTRPRDINALLLTEWDTKCRKSITSTREIMLSEAFRHHIETFDFSIVHELPPLDLIALHGRTRYHAVRFGGGLTRKRPKMSSPPSDIDRSENPYVGALFAAFGEHLASQVSSRQHFEHCSEVREAFDYAREGYYSAESLKEFVRDTLPDEEDFNDLLDETFDGLRPVVNQAHVTGYARLEETTKAAVLLSFASNVLNPQLRHMDRIGFCHHLVNRSRMKWIRS